MTPLVPIIGHQAETAALLRDRDGGNVAHAYLLAGPKGVGKFTTALWFAGELLTEGLEGAEREKALGQVRRLLHPDLHVLDWLWMEDVREDLDEIAKHSNVPQEHRKKAKAKTDSISIDDVRSLQDRLHEVGTGRYKCCLIRSVECMHDEAVNALLKILEEPPEGTVFLLTTESLHALLPTIVSRARVLRFSRLGTAELEPLLAGTDDSDRRFNLRVAQGAPGTVKRLLSGPDLLRKEREVFASATAFWHSPSAHERLTILKPLHEKGEEADRLVLHLSIALREELTELPPESSEALSLLIRDLHTNASRQLLAQRFALQTAPGRGA